MSNCERLQHNARWSVVMNIYAQAAGGAYRRHCSRVSKQAGAFRVHSTFCTCLTVLFSWNYSMSGQISMDKLYGIAATFFAAQTLFRSPIQ